MNLFPCIDSGNKVQPHQQAGLRNVTNANFGSGTGPGAPLTYFNDRGVRQRFIFYTQKNPNFRICVSKKIPTFLAYPKKSLSVFASANFIIYLLES